MRSKNYILFIFFLSLFVFISKGQVAEQNGFFIENSGQWGQDFTFKLPINEGAFFFSDSSILGNFSNTPDPHQHQANKGNHHDIPEISFAYEMKFSGASKSVKLQALQEGKFYHNYILGNDPKYWKSEVAIAESIIYNNIYQNINIEYFPQGNDLKYNIRLQPKSDMSEIQLEYNGIDGLRIEEGKLIIKSPKGNLVESIPVSYQIINGIKKIIKVEYILINDSTVGFKAKRYNSDFELIIDPVLEFSTLSGSTSDNFGFTATYSADGSLYAGGIAEAIGYPTSLGAYQSTFNGVRDITISKFTSDGTQLVYSTYIGGTGIDLPSSLIENSQGELLILATTGSSDYPLTTNAYQGIYGGGPNTTAFPWNFNNGADLVISKLSSNGTTLLASTYFGGNDMDGVNTGIYENYGDLSRGEITVDAADNVYIASNTSSTNFSISNFNSLGNQDAIVVAFNQNLSQLIWGSRLGGADEDVAYSLKIDAQGDIYVAGGTKSNNVTTSIDADDLTYSGNTDGFLWKLNGGNGTMMKATYCGNSGYDQTYFIEIDKNDNIYTLGQSDSSTQASANTYSNPNSKQFIIQYNRDLSLRNWQTEIGSGLNKFDLVPTAFMVDDCLNIYLSGWNGSSNRVSSTGLSRGNTMQLAITPDALQSTSDGSDFYFMVLSRNAEALVFGSFFGGSAAEHVDGGTSRFDRNGIVYQSVCAACNGGTYPTTPNAYSTTNGSSNCNLGAIKLDFQQVVTAESGINFSSIVDTSCQVLEVKFTNGSSNANSFLWDFGNGNTSTDFEPTTLYPTFGTYTITLVSYDTICGTSDTTLISITHDKGIEPIASFTVEYTACDSEYKIKTSNFSSKANVYEWNFGDGTSSTAFNPNHSYSAPGTYEIELIALDTSCVSSDTTSTFITFIDTIPTPVVQMGFSDCSDGSVVVSFINDKPSYSYYWEIDGVGIYTGREPGIKLTQDGIYPVRILINDSVCNTDYVQESILKLDRIQGEVFIPNAFTPNGDDLNDFYEISGNQCNEQDELRIFNRWGQIIFYTQNPYSEFWDGYFNGEPAPLGVYTYNLQFGKEVKKGSFTLYR